MRSYRNQLRGEWQRCRRRSASWGMRPGQNDVLLDEKFVEECNHLKTMLLLAVPGESGAPEERHFKEAATSRDYLLQHKPNSFHKVLTLFGAGMYLAKKISEMIQATLCTQISNI